MIIACAHQRCDFLDACSALCRCENHVVETIFVKSRTDVVNKQEMERSNEPSSLVPVEERVVPHDEEAVGGGLLVERREALVAENPCLGLGQA